MYILSVLSSACLFVQDSCLPFPWLCNSFRSDCILHIRSIVPRPPPFVPFVWIYNCYKEAGRTMKNREGSFISCVVVWSGVDYWRWITTSLKFYRVTYSYFSHPFLYAFGRTGAVACKKFMADGRDWQTFTLVEHELTIIQLYCSLTFAPQCLHCPSIHLCVLFPPHMHISVGQQPSTARNRALL